MTRFTCPECGKEIQATCESSSKRMECPHCHDIVLVPARHARTTPAVPESAPAPGLIAWLGEGLRYTTCPQGQEVASHRSR